MKHLSWIIIALVLCGCISVNLPNAGGHKANAIWLEAPRSPFEEIKSDTADRAWLSSKNGNTISFLSDCNNPVDPPLQQIESDSLNVLANLKIISSKNINYSGREALETTAAGQVDGVNVKMKLLTNKKNNCSYSLIYGGVTEKFDSELKFFDNFIKGFKAP